MALINTTNEKICKKCNKPFYSDCGNKKGGNICPKCKVYIRRCSKCDNIYRTHSPCSDICHNCKIYKKVCEKCKKKYISKTHLTKYCEKCRNSK